MEFLVRLTDKTNIQVFCLNPVHKGLRMDRVFYEDDTHGAPCPECGSSDFLYRKNNAISKKGHFVTFKPDGWTWGYNERKHFGIVRIDCTYEEAQAWCEGIKNEQAEQDIAIYEITGNDIQLKVAENRAMIDARPRKYAFDFEKVLTASKLKTWNDQRKYSGIVTIPSAKLSHIKEI